MLFKVRYEIVEVIDNDGKMPRGWNIGLIANDKVKLLFGYREPDQSLVARIAHRLNFLQAQHVSIKLSRSRNVPPRDVVSDVMVANNSCRHAVHSTRACALIPILALTFST